LKTASILHVNSQSLVLADYGVKTGYCQGASLLRFSVEMFPASLRSRQKTRVLQQNVKIYSLVFSILACAWQPIIKQ
jgi:hypothetical protein